MRMGMAQVPRESLVWMDSLVRATPKDMPIVYIAHNPVEKSLSNWDHVYDILKQGNLVLTMGRALAYETISRAYDGIPAVIGRSSLCQHAEVRRSRLQPRADRHPYRGRSHLQPSGRWPHG